MGKLTGKKILITGGATRLGGMFSQALAEEGAELFIHYHENLQGAEKIGAAAGINGKKAYLFQADFRSVKDVFQLVKKVRTVSKQLDILIHNASVFTEADTVKGTHNILSEDFTTWDEAFAVHVRAPFFLTQAFYSELAAARQRDSGRVISILDAQATVGMVSRAAYSLSKKSLEDFTYYAAMSLKPKVEVYGLVLKPTLPAADMTEAEKKRLIWQNPEGAVKALVDLCCHGSKEGVVLSPEEVLV